MCGDFDEQKQLDERARRVPGWHRPSFAPSSAREWNAFNDPSGQS
jgi:hypothetical protein